MFTFAVADNHDRVVISVAEFGAKPNSLEDATPAFQRAIAAARAFKGPVVIDVPRGRYDFFSPHATRRRCYFSNATEAGSDAMRTIALDLSDLTDVTLRGHEARFVMRGKMTMVAAERSRNLSLSGLEFDFARPTVSEIAAVEKGEGYWIGVVHPDSTYRLEGNRIRWVGEDWSAFHNLTQHFDPETQTTWRGDDPTAGATSVRETAPRHLRFETPSQVVVGRTFQFRDITRDEAGMWFSRCKNVSMERVKIRAMAEFGVLFQFTDTVTIKEIEVAPTTESGRTCVASADILHFSGCRGKIAIRNSVLSAAHDDAINIHGTHLRVMQAEGRDRIRVRFMHDQTWGFAAFAPGDEIEFVRKDTLLPYASAKVKALEMGADPREQILTLDRPLPSVLALDSDAVENVTWTPSVEVSECEISRVPTRGILVTTRRPVRITGNRFNRIPMPSVLVEDDARGWYESGSVRDLLVSGNTFFECSGPVVEVNPQIAKYAGAVHQNIRVEANQFVHCGFPFVNARAVDGLRVLRNRFLASNPAPADLARMSQCPDARIEGNVTVLKH